MQKTFLIIPLIFLSLLTACQSDKKQTIQEENAQNQKENRPKEHLYIRGKSPSIIGPHERLAKQYPNSYFIEGKTQQKLVALTFDDGPSPYTLAVAKILEKHNIKGTFFMLGNQMQRFPEIVKTLDKAGHIIANHTWNHPNANTFKSPKTYWQQQVFTQIEVTEQLIGKRPLLFRPPFGSISEAQHKEMKTNGLATIIWSIDTVDWDEANSKAKTIAGLTQQHSHPEAIILMHDGGGNRQATVDSLEQTINFYKKNGYQFVTVDKLLGLSAYQ